MSDNFSEVVEALALMKKSACVTAAAGCGKTEAIVKAVEKSEGKQLILTHTNSGVAALRSRLRKNSVPESKYRVDTIASWLLKYSASYKSMSKLANINPRGKDWNEVYPSAERLFVYPFIKDVLMQSYSGVFVDEYQDCTKQQHEIIMKMGEFLPIRVLGDPLQGIFGFNPKDPLINWKNDITDHFEVLPDLIFPFRWKKTPNNEALGEQLAEIRIKIVAHDPINLASYPQIEYHCWSEKEEELVCSSFSQSKSGHIAGIFPSVQPSTNGDYLDLISAEKKKGTYQYIEEMDCYTLFKFAKIFDSCKNSHICIRKNFEMFLKEGISNFSSNLPGLQGLLSEIDAQGFAALPEVIDYANKSCAVYRKELFSELKKATIEYLSGNSSTFHEAAYIARSKTRSYGRKVENRIISRTLLIKGLEFDHVIVLNLDAFNKTLHPKEHFYVAITRGCQSMAILGSSPSIQFDN